MNKEFYVKAILAHRYSFKLSGDCKTTVCNWCDTRTSMAGSQEEAEHAEDCPYLLASNEE